MKKQNEEVTVDKAKKLKDLRAQLDKQFGKGSLMCANESVFKRDYISTGSIGLDGALGIGGLPKGRIVEIYGPESSGKTTLAIHVIAEAHAADPETRCAIIDAEHALDREYARALGVDIDRLDISQPDYGEQGLEIADSLIDSGLYSVIVVDSVAALVPKSELDGEMGDASMGKHARLMSQALRKLTATVSKNDTILIFINQLRDKIGVMMGNPETTTGGNALKFYASVRLDVRRSTTAENSVMDSDGEKSGNKVTVKVIKNKLAPPFRKCSFNILYGIGIDKFGEIVDAAVDMNIINRSGSWFSYGEAKIGQGIASVRALLADNEELLKEIKEKINNNK